MTYGSTVDKKISSHKVTDKSPKWQAQKHSHALISEWNQLIEVDIGQSLLIWIVIVSSFKIARTQGRLTDIKGFFSVLNVMMNLGYRQYIFELGYSFVKCHCRKQASCYRAAMHLEAVSTIEVDTMTCWQAHHPWTTNVQIVVQGMCSFSVKGCADSSH